MRDCPKKIRAAALLAEETSSKDEEGQVFLSPLQLLNALSAERSSQPRELMYAKALVNGAEVLAMLDTGATHNFVAEGVAKKLGLRMERSFSKLKAVNSEAKPIQGTAAVCLKVGDWEGECSLMVLPLDDYDLILGMDFFRRAKAVVVPHLGGMFIHEEKSPCFVKAMFAGRLLDSKQNEKVLLAQQSKAGKEKLDRQEVIHKMVACEGGSSSPNLGDA